MRKKLEAALNRLEEQDIIEKATGPTPWVSPVVVFPKANNPTEVRVCLDMRQVNTAVLRKRHVTPTIDEIIHDLNGACNFQSWTLAVVITN